MKTTALFYVGLLLLTLLSIQDFRNKITRRGHSGEYYTCMSLFVIINAFLYFAICCIALNAGFGDLLLGQIEDRTQESQALPILIAFAYFGVGSANIPWGDKALSFYGALLKLFQGMYTPKKVDIDPIKREIKRLDAHSELLADAIESFNDTGETYGWNVLKDQWQDLSQYKQDLESHGQSLRLVREELGAETVTKDRIVKVNNWLDDKLGQIAKDINEKMRQHISKLVVANEKNQPAIEKLLSSIGLKLPDVPHISPSTISLSRAVVFSLFGGAILGSLSSYWEKTPHGVHVVRQVWPWMLGIGVFGSVFSSVARLRKEGTVWAIALGAIAGAAGQLILRLVKIALGVTDKPWNFADLTSLVIGVVFGASLGLLIHVFRYWVRPRVQSSYKCYLFVALAGAALFVALASIMHLGPVGDIRNIGFMLMIGSSVSLVAAVITNIFHTRS